MPAYVIADLRQVTDLDKLMEYGRLTSPTIKAHGGRYLAAGENIEVLDGSWESDRLVILEFPDMETVRRWYNSEAYQPLIAIRQAASRGALVAIEKPD